MSKLLTLFLLISICSCNSNESKSVDTENGGAVETPDSSDNSFPEDIPTGDLFYIVVPEAYSKNGSAQAEETTSGFYISIPELDGLGESTITNGLDALLLIRAACDNIASAATNIVFEPTISTIMWDNISSQSGSLSITNTFVGSPPLREVTCID